MKFTELNLKPEVMMGLKKMGYDELTPIQAETIPHILVGEPDLVLPRPPDDDLNSLKRD